MIYALELLVAQNIGFTIIAMFMIAAAFRVVTARNVVHAALSLVLVLAGVAAQYILLGAEFVAVAQVMVYIGAVVVLFLFGIMLTRAPLGLSDDLDNNQKGLSAVVACGMAGLLGYALWDAFGIKQFENIVVQRTSVLSDAIFGQYLVPFEVISVLLLAALIGAVVIARRD